jgi:hypothetical protein
LAQRYLAVDPDAGWIVDEPAGNDQKTASLLLRPLTLQQTLQSGDLASGQWIVGVSKASMDLGYQ